MMNRFTPNKYKYKFIQENGVLNYQYKYFVQLWFKYKYIDSNTDTKNVQPNISAEVYSFAFQEISLALEQLRDMM